MKERLMETDFSELEFSLRTSNSLKRAGYTIIEMLILAINSEEDLLKIRNSGRMSADEIVMQFMVFQ